MSSFAYPAIRPVSNVIERSFAWWDSGYDADEIRKIIALGESLAPKQAVVNGGAEGSNLIEQRDSQVAWIEPRAHTTWLFERLAEQAAAINEKFFRFDLSAFAEPLQYTVYDSQKGGQHYDWHVDSTGEGRTPRKLSAVLLLSDPMDFEGGELWVHGPRREALPKVRGRVYFFPSYTLHRVTPVTSGVRRSLVVWIAGPEFR